MQVTKYSRDRMMISASHWNVPLDYFDPLYNYLVCGFKPGSFWTAVLCNDFMAAIQHSHPSNDIPALKNTVGWIRDSFPPESYGEVRRVEQWLELPGHQRRASLEAAHMIYTEQQEIMMTLKGERSYAPLLS
jgi:hypothetical protein